MFSNRFLIAILLAVGSCQGAFNATTIWRTSALSGSDTNGGAFDPGVASPGTDESCGASVTCASGSPDGAGTAVTVTLTGTGTTGTSSPAFTSTTHGPGNFIAIDGSITSGTYTSGGTITGTVTQTCDLAFGFGGSGGTATVALTGTNTIAGGTALTVVLSGTYILAPTVAVLSNGTATCSGVAVVATTLTTLSAGCTIGTYEILSQSGGTATFDKSMGSSASACAGMLGGPMVSISLPAARVVAGNIVGIRADATYSVSANIAMSTGGSSGSPIIYEGYSTTLGDNGSFTVQATIALTGIFTVSGTANNLANFICDNNSFTGTTRCINSSGSQQVYANGLMKNWATYAFFSSSNNNQAINLRATAGLSGCSEGFATSSGFVGIGLIADTNPCTGASGIGIYIYCIWANNTGATSDGFLNSQSSYFVNNIFYGNGRYGLNVGSNNTPYFEVRNSWFYGNGSKSINVVNAFVTTTQFQFDYNAYPSGSLTGLTAGPHDITLTADPSVAGASLNFALNSTAGGGALLKATGFPGTLQAGGTGYLSIGPLQPQASTAGAISGLIQQGIIQ